MRAGASDRNARQSARRETEDIQKTKTEVVGRCGVNAGEDRIEGTAQLAPSHKSSCEARGERSTGNVHAPFDVAGDGNQLTVLLMRHSQRKRGATARLNLPSKAPFFDPTRPSEPSAGFAKRFIDGWFL